MDDEYDVYQAWYSSAWARGEKSKEHKRLVGNNFPPYPKPKVPKAIRATPKVLCNTCGKLPVLAELNPLTKGQCWTCHLEGAKALCQEIIHR